MINRGKLRMSENSQYSVYSKIGANKDEVFSRLPFLHHLAPSATPTSNGEELFQSTYDKFAFDSNKALDSCSIILAKTSKRKNIVMEDYMARMRKVYYENINREVDWFGQSATGNFLGYPKTERAFNAYVGPKLACIAQFFTGMSFMSAIRRHSYTFEEVYRTLLMGGMMGTLGFYMCMQHGFIAYFWQGEKYLDDKNSLKNECAMCWSGRALAAIALSSFIVPPTIMVVLAETNEKHRGKLIGLNEIWTRKYWLFWTDVFRQILVKNGRPKICAPNFFLASTAALSVYTVFETVYDERQFRDLCIKHYTENVSSSSF